MIKGTRHSPETIEKIGKAMRGRTMSPEARKKLSLAMTGHKRSPETIEKMRQARMRRKPLSPEAIENIRRGQLGKHMSPEARKNMRRASLGRRHTPETKEKMRQSHLGKKNLMWNGGIAHWERGYLSIYAPNHPCCTKSRYVREHRLVVESCLKRFLKPSECVHHINKITNDNRPENLMVFKSQNAHTSFDKWGKPAKPGDIIFDGRSLKH